jgi:hypothetical protein
MKSTITGSREFELAKLPFKGEIQEPCYAWPIDWGHHGDSRYTEYALRSSQHFEAGPIHCGQSSEMVDLMNANRRILDEDAVPLGQPALLAG